MPPSQRLAQPRVVPLLASGKDHKSDECSVAWWAAAIGNFTTQNQYRKIMGGGGKRVGGVEWPLKLSFQSVFTVFFDVL